jgi:hypothetical protein
MFIAARCLRIICQVLKDQPLIKSPERRCQIGQIVWGADDKAISLSDCIQNSCKAITTDTVPFILFLFTSETGDTSCILLQLEEIEVL